MTPHPPPPLPFPPSSSSPSLRGKEGGGEKERKGNTHTATISQEIVAVCVEVYIFNQSVKSIIINYFEIYINRRKCNFDIEFYIKMSRASLLKNLVTSSYSLIFVF